MKRLLIAAVLGLAATAALAEYTGPSAVPAMTVKQLLDTGVDDQYGALQGRLISHDGGEHCTFADDTGTGSRAHQDSALIHRGTGRCAPPLVPVSRLAKSLEI